MGRACSFIVCWSMNFDLSGRTMKGSIPQPPPSPIAPSPPPPPAPSQNRGTTVPAYPPPNAMCFVFRHVLHCMHSRVAFDFALEVVITMPGTYTIFETSLLLSDRSGRGFS